MNTGLQKTKPRLDPRVGLIVGTLGFASSSTLVRLSNAPSLAIAALRLLITVALLTPYVLLRHRADLKKLTRRDILLCALAGVFLAVHFWSWFESLRHTTVAIAATLCNADAIFTAIGFALFLKGRIPKAGMAAIALAFVGSAIIAFSSGGEAKTGQLLGAGLALLAALLFAVYTLLGSVLRKHLNNNVYTWLVYSACATTLLLCCAVTRTPLWGWDRQVYLVSLGLAVFPTFLGHSMFNWCLEYLSPAYVATGHLAEPVFSAIMAAILFSEVPAPLQLVGAVLVLAGVFLYTMVESRQKPPPAANDSPAG
ncbi:DMT family transporter [Ruminococcaceae bacterium OttesenSCG-928-D13]|nr:DMT family transporter [Ruminococcaceae bacterium OttesenSCG-928-D13]